MSHIIPLVLGVVFSLFHAEGSDSFMTLDIRTGLPESRIRNIRMLPGGWTAIAGTASISLFDGCNVVISREIPGSACQAIPAYEGFRKIGFTCDSVIWLKNKGTLHAFAFPDLVPVEDFRCLFSRYGIDYVPVDVYPLGDALASLREKGGLYLSEKGTNRLLFDTSTLHLDEAPQQVLADSLRLYLCYRSGRIVAVDRKEKGKLIYSGILPRSGRLKDFSRGINAAVGNDTLCFSRNNVEESEGELSFFDVAARKLIGTVDVPFRVSDLVYCNGRWLAVGQKGLIWVSWIDGRPVADMVDSFRGKELSDDLSCVAVAGNGSVMIGTAESGILYSDTLRRDGFRKVDGWSVDSRSIRNVFPSAALESLAAAYADGLTNCSAVDAGGYSYLGTINGLMVFTPEADPLFTVSRSYGLASDNIRALIVYDDSTLWGSASEGVFRIRHDSRGGFEIRNYGIPDGIDLEGKEFRPREMVMDSTGAVYVGFPGGAYRFYPDSVSRGEYGLYRFDAARKNGRKLGLVWLIWVGLAVMVVVCVVTYGVRDERSRPKASPCKDYVESNDLEESSGEDLDSGAKDMAEESKEPDQDFVVRLTALIKDNIENERLSVALLSSGMAMERSVLYRKTQASLGMSPSVYIRRLKIEEAKRLLAETDLLVADIAVKTGFSTARYFTQSFKESTGVTPSVFRMNQREHPV